MAPALPAACRAFKLGGFTDEALLHRSHNIVRHPGLQPQALRVPLEQPEVGQALDGIVMNRCKDGDHRWLVACVMRIQRDGANVECQSVRFKGDKSWVERAEAIDKRLARSSGSPSPRAWPSATG